MFRGRLVVQGTMDELAMPESERGVLIEVDLDRVTPSILRALEELDGVRRVRATENHLTLSCVADVRARVAETVLGEGAKLLTLKSESQTLEDIYLRYFQQSEDARGS
jgi:ABC-type multidrug transport system ATPase subunit